MSKGPFLKLLILFSPLKLLFFKPNSNKNETYYSGGSPSKQTILDSDKLIDSLRTPPSLQKWTTWIKKNLQLKQGDCMTCFLYSWCFSFWKDAVFWPLTIEDAQMLFKILWFFSFQKVAVFKKTAPKMLIWEPCVEVQERFGWPFGVWFGLVWWVSRSTPQLRWR